MKIRASLACLGAAGALGPVPCDSGFRDERVVQWASSEAECIQPIDATIWTVDGVLLCTVWDYT